MPEISIIVPIYMAERFLPQCLDSLLAQTFTDIEILCINDGSPDCCQAIVEGYAARDPRVILIHQENQGISGARNTGLAHAKGRYIQFLDADDWLSPTCCETAHRRITQDASDIVLWGYVRERQHGGIPVSVAAADTVWGEADCHAFLRRLVGPYGDEMRNPEKMDLFANVWSKLYKASMLREAGISFIDTKEIGTEDQLFNMQVFRQVKRASIVAKALTHYRKDNPESLTTAFNPLLAERWRNLYRRMDVWIAQQNLDETFRQALQNRIAVGVVFLGLRIVMLPLSFSEKHRKIAEMLINTPYCEAFASIKTKGMPITWRTFFFCARHGLTLPVMGMLRAMVFLGRRM